MNKNVFDCPFCNEKIEGNKNLDYLTCNCCGNIIKNEVSGDFLKCSKPYKINFDNPIPFQEKYDLSFKSIPHFNNWPVVYIIINDKKNVAYIGQTVDLESRLMNHYSDPSKVELKNNNTKVLFVDYFYANKSTCLQLESFLINNFYQDGRYQLLNGNEGIHRYDYYLKKYFNSVCEEVWDDLKKHDIVSSSIKEIKDNKMNYSPYLELNKEQYSVIKQIVRKLAIDNKNTIAVNGAAGTGKTIVAIHLLKLLYDYSINNNKVVLEDMVDDKIDDVKIISDYFFNNIKTIGIVYPMYNVPSVMRKSIKSLFPKKTKIKVFQPSEAVDYYLENGKFDLLIIDEAQRLSIEGFGTSDQGRKKSKSIFKKLGISINSNSSQLDWFNKISNNLIFFYDFSQKIRKGDITEDLFNSFVNKRRCSFLNLTIQERCYLGGEKYINCIKNIFNPNTIFDESTINKLKDEITNINNKYKFKMFDNIMDLDKKLEDLRKKKKKVYMLSGYCRYDKDDGEITRKFNILKSKYKPRDIKDDENKYEEFISFVDKYDLYDIRIKDNYRNIWNYPLQGWVKYKVPSSKQVGTVYQVSGLEADYCGVIISYELVMDDNNKMWYINDFFADKPAKKNASEEDIFSFILDCYYILMTRAREGTFIYVCDDQLRELFNKFMP